jgi:hypothetical protein
MVGNGVRLGLNVDVGMGVRVDVAGSAGRGVAVLVGIAVNVNVGRGVLVGETVMVGRGVREGLGVALKFGLRVMVGERVIVGVREGGREGVSVSVFVRVGVLDKAATASCASRVREARVASALRFSVGEGRRLVVGEAVTVEVLVLDGTGVREGVGVEETVTG